jgi:hypothetical protein
LDAILESSNEERGLGDEICERKRLLEALPAELVRRLDARHDKIEDAQMLPRKNKKKSGRSGIG